MKHYKETVRSSTYQELVKSTCDCCGGEISKDHWSDYKTRDFTLEFTTETRYPSGSDEEGWAVEDCCDACVEVLRSAISAAGFKITLIDRSY